jgi:drug/metabolite transporter (DMT)-like permease
MIKRLVNIPSLGSTAVTLSAAAVLLAPLAAARLPSQVPDARVVASVVALGLVCTALAYVLYYNLIVAAGATRAALITYVNPAVAVVLGVLALAEPLTPGTVVGFALIVIGCAMSTGAGRAALQPTPKAGEVA